MTKERTQMELENIKSTVLETMDENVGILTDALDLFEHENKVKILNLLSQNSVLVKSALLNIWIIYTLIAYKEDTAEITNARENLFHMSQAEPLIKDIINIYLRVVEIEDLNPNMSPQLMARKNKRLLDVLTSI